MSNYLKPQTPIKLGDNYIYPLTTADQISISNGNRLNSLFKKTIKETITLLSSNWSDTLPYTQTITILESTDDYNVDANIAYSGNETDTKLNKAAGCISYIKKNHKEISFYCLKNKPEVDIPVELNCTCRNTIATVEEGIKLNFDIKRYSSEEEMLADTPMENTIGVISDVEITGYRFSSTEPENMNEGEVWIKTGDDSIIAFDMIEGITIYPLSVKQNINNIWENKIAYTYHNETWIEWITYLFNYSRQSYNWISKGWYHSGTSQSLVSPTTVVNSDGSVTLSMSVSNGTTPTGGYEITEDIDFTNIDTLKIEYDILQTGNSRSMDIVIIKRNSTYYANDAAIIKSISSSVVSNAVAEIDTSELSGMFSVAVCLYINGSKTSGTISGTIRRIMIQ